jgi:hypothetical protein
MDPLPEFLAEFPSVIPDSQPGSSIFCVGY